MDANGLTEARGGRGHRHAAVFSPTAGAKEAVRLLAPASRS